MTKAPKCTRTPSYVAYRAEYIRQRRAANAKARARGFRNHSDMYLEEA